MKTPPLTLLSITLLVCSAGVAAEEATPPARSPILEATPPSKSAKAPAPDAPPRMVSSEMGAKLAATRPTYAPKVAAKPTEQWPDARETDKPRNGIVRLPPQIVEKYLMPRAAPVAAPEAGEEVVQMSPYIVRDIKVPQLKEREILTPHGKRIEALRRRPGLRFLGNAGLALAMLEDDYERERNAEIRDLYGLYRYTEPKTGAEATNVSGKSSPRPKAPQPE